VIISKSTTFYYSPQKDSNGKRCCKSNVVAKKSLLLQRLQAFLLLKVTFILYFIFDAFNGNFSDDDNYDNKNNILPNLSKGVLKLGRVLNNTSVFQSMQQSLQLSIYCIKVDIYIYFYIHALATHQRYCQIQKMKV
jgi:hypothetical protein